LIELFSEFIDGKHVFLPGVGRNSIDETIAIAESAVKVGADALVVVTPYYLKMDEKSVFRYFDKVADKIDADIILYNIPQFTGNLVTLDMAKRLVEKHKNIVGVKDSSGDFRSISGFIEGMGKNFIVFQGQDDLLLPSLMIGAHGGVCGTTNFTKLAFGVYKAHAAGKINKAKSMQEKLTNLMRLFTQAQFPSDYNYMFYRKIMHSKETNAVPPLESIGDKYGNALYESASKLML
jgi:4-hydroxy-tetrahydrodipicolinate synthase/2-dehydro-3-deoxy-D-gluconate aldolase